MGGLGAGAGRLGTFSWNKRAISEWRDVRRQKIGLFGLVVEGPTWNDLEHSFQVLDLFQAASIILITVTLSVSVSDCAILPM